MTQPWQTTQELRIVVHTATVISLCFLMSGLGVLGKIPPYQRLNLDMINSKMNLDHWVKSQVMAIALPPEMFAGKISKKVI